MATSHPILAPFKAQELAYRHAGILLVSDPQLMAVALAWQVTTVHMQTPPPDMRLLESELWDWLCEHCDFDDTKLCRSAGLLSETETELLLDRLFAHRLVYPDGSCAMVVSEVVGMKLLEAITPPGLK